VVEAAGQDEVGEGGGAAPGPGDEVVHLACGGPLAAAGERAVPVPGDDGAPQVRRDGAGHGADVEGQADPGGLRAGQPGAQRRGEAGRPGGCGPGLPARPGRRDRTRWG
jgi:hypothetical protein